MKIFLTTVNIILLFVTTIFPQVSADLTIANQQAVGTDFFFDIYLTRTGTNDVYLATGDIVLTFNSAAFNNPVLSKESFSYWNLNSSLGTSVGTSYWAAMGAAAITGNELNINMNVISFGETQEGFDIFVARIDNTPSTHRLGRYKVSGITNPAAFMNLQWKTTGTGVVLQLFTYQSVSPWSSSAVTINAINPGNAPLPVELTSFTALYKSTEIMLNWETKTEVNNYGFSVERKVGEGNWGSIGFIAGNGNTNSPKEYSYTDKYLFAGGIKFQYRLKQIDNDGSFEYSNVVEVEVVPDQYELAQNYPNPFNPGTAIQFSLPKQTQLKINLYNMLGEQIATITEGMFESGYHKVTYNASTLPSGTYVYRLESADFVQVKKMILLK